MGGGYLTLGGNLKSLHSLWELDWPPFARNTVYIHIDIYIYGKHDMMLYVE